MEATTATPMIDTSKLKSGTIVYIETAQAVYELTITDDPQVFEVNGSPEMFRTKRRVRGSLVITPNCRIQFAFADATYQCQPALHATVRGNGFSFDVF